MQRVKPVTWGFIIGGIVIGGLIANAFVNAVNLKPSDVVRVNLPKPKLQAAIKEARNGLPGFLKELAAPKPGEAFAIKGTFQTPNGPEYLWVKHPDFKDGKFSGVLDQKPIAVIGKDKGDAVTFPEKDAVDWLIKDDDGIRGEFTEKALSGP